MHICPYIGKYKNRVCVKGRKEGENEGEWGERTQLSKHYLSLPLSSTFPRAQGQHILDVNFICFSSWPCFLSPLSGLWPLSFLSVWQLFHNTEPETNHSSLGLTSCFSWCICLATRFYSNSLWCRIQSYTLMFFSSTDLRIMSKNRWWDAKTGSCLNNTY